MTTIQNCEIKQSKFVDFNSSISPMDYNVSETIFSGVFKINRAAQTEISFVADLKKLFYKFNLLIISANEEQVEADEVNERKAKIALDTFARYADRKTLDSQINLQERQKVIHAAHRTMLANKVSELSLQFERELDRLWSQEEQSHTVRIRELEAEINKMKIDLLRKRSESDRLGGQFLKMTKAARKGGHDLPSLISENKYQNRDLLERLQTALRSKEETRNQLQLKIKNETEHLQQQRELHLKLESERKAALDSKINQSKSQNFQIPTKPALDFEAEAAILTAEFEKQKEIEFALIKESKERYESSYKELLHQSCNSLLTKNKNLLNLLDVTKSIFQAKAVKTRNYDCQTSED